MNKSLIPAQSVNNYMQTYKTRPIFNISQKFTDFKALKRAFLEGSDRSEKQTFDRPTLDSLFNGNPFFDIGW